MDQRVKQQNEASLVQFNVRISYNDKSSVLLNSLEDLLAYREVRPVTSVAAHLSWTYLIKFQNRPTPEKQVIELSLTTDTHGRFLVHPAVLSPRELFYSESPNFYLRIAHTARTWGTDIENLLSGQINGWIREEHGIKRFVYHQSGWIGFGVGVTFLALTWFALYRAMQPAAVAFKAAAEKASLGSMDEKISFLVQAQTYNPLYYETPFVTLAAFVCLVASVILGVIVGTLAENPPRSYLVLSEQARKAREKDLRARVWTWGYFVGSAIASTVAGVCSRYIFMFFFSRTWP